MYKNNSGRRPLLFKHILLWIIIYLDMSRIKMCNIICYCQYIMDNSSYKIRFYLYQKAMTLIWPICTTGGFLCPILTSGQYIWPHLQTGPLIATPSYLYIYGHIFPFVYLWPHLTSDTYHPNLSIYDHIIPHTYYDHILPLTHIIPTCTLMTTSSHIPIMATSYLLHISSQLVHLRTDHLTSRRGGLCFFSKKIFWFPMMLKKYSDFGGGKKKNLIQSFCHIT
jgi:hypothetical protein